MLKNKSAMHIKRRKNT